MNSGNSIIIDTTTEKLPQFIEKNNASDKAWITCEVKINEQETWKGIVTNISSSGKYTIRLTEKIE